jgi:hypothetical protein
MYKVLKVEGGWSVFWQATPETEPVLVPHTNGLGQVTPYAHRQAAYRRCKKLNEAVKNVDAMIAKDGAIIL